MPLWLERQPLVLASQSQVRGKMIAAAGLRFEIRPANIDERAVETEAAFPMPPPRRGCWRAPRRKPCRRSARTTGARRRSDFGAGLDAVQASRLTADKATEQLRALRGGPTNCIRAVALMRDGVMLFDCVDTARLTMRDVSDRFLSDYLDMAGEAAVHSVGAYQLEGIGIHLFEKARVTTSPFSACRCCRCSSFCGRKSLSMGSCVSGRGAIRSIATQNPGIQEQLQEKNKDGSRFAAHPFHACAAPRDTGEYDVRPRSDRLDRHG